MRYEPRPAVTRYRVLQRAGNWALVEASRRQGPAPPDPRALRGHRPSARGRRALRRPGHPRARSARAARCARRVPGRRRRRRLRRERAAPEGHGGPARRPPRSGADSEIAPVSSSTRHVPPLRSARFLPSRPVTARPCRTHYRAPDARLSWMRGGACSSTSGVNAPGVAQHGLGTHRLGTSRKAQPALVVDSAYRALFLNGRDDRPARAGARRALVATRWVASAFARPRVMVKRLLAAGLNGEAKVGDIRS